MEESMGNTLTGALEVWEQHNVRPHQPKPSIDLDNYVPVGARISECGTLVEFPHGEDRVRIVDLKTGRVHEVPVHVITARVNSPRIMIECTKTFRDLKNALNKGRNCLNK